MLDLAYIKPLKAYTSKGVWSAGLSYEDMVQSCKDEVSQ